MIKTKTLISILSAIALAAAVMVTFTHAPKAEAGITSRMSSLRSSAPRVSRSVSKPRTVKAVKPASKPKKTYSKSHMAGSAATGVAAGVIAAEVLDEIGDSLEQPVQAAEPRAVSAGKTPGVIRCDDFEVTVCQVSDGFFKTKNLELADYVKRETGKDVTITGISAFPNQTQGNLTSAFIYFEY